MQTSSLFRSVPVALCATFLAGQIVSAVPVLWTGAGGNDNWSTAGNWSGGAPAGNEVFFGDLDATGGAGPFGTVNNIVNASQSISRLSYTNLATIGYHTTQIPSGVTLTVTNSGNTILVNQPFINTADAQVYATVLGAGTLNVTNPSGVISLGQGSTTANASRRATLDLSGLDNFRATVGRIVLGQQTAHSNRANATLLLAKTNIIDLAQAAPTAGLQIGDIQSNNGNSQIVELGVTNVILSDSGLTVGGRKGDGFLRFNSALVPAGTGKALFRARNGVGRQAQWRVGDNTAQVGGGSFANGTVDFSTYGSVDALVDTLTLGWGTAGTAAITTPSVGVLTFDAGTVDVNTLRLGVQPNVDGGAARGTVNVNGAGQLIVNGNVLMGSYLGGSYNSFGEINIGALSGGAVTVKGDVICGGGVGNKIAVFGALTLGGKLGDAVNATNTPLQTLDLWSGSLTFARANAGLPVTPLVQVTNLNVHGSVSVVVSGANFSVGQFPLIKYYSGLGDVGGFVGFSGLALTLPNNVEGYLSNHTANASVDLVITALTTKKWSGVVNGNWDINTTTNWLNFPSGTPAKYLEPSVPGDAVTFDDSATGTTTVNLTTTLSPDGIKVTNVLKTYTFTGTGALSGPTGLNKQGAGTLVLANSGVNTFSNPVVIEAGAVQLSGSADRLPTNGTVTLANVAGAAFNLNGFNQTLGALNGGGAAGGHVSLGAGNLTVIGGGGNYAGVISGAGTVIKSGTGTQVLSGANVHTGGVVVQGGTLTLANTTGSGAGPGSVAVTVSNAVLSLGDGGANGSVSAGVLTNDGIVRISRSDDVVFTNTLVGLGVLQIQSSNLVVVSGNNSHTGGSTITRGALRIGSAGALGPGPVTVGNLAPAVLQLSNNVNVANALIVNNKTSASGAVPNVENLHGTNTLSGPLQLTGNGAVGWIFDATAGRLVVASTMLPPASTTQNVQRNLYLRGDADGEWSGGIIDPVGGTTNLALVKVGLGAWTLSGVNTYTGPTQVTNGTLVVNGTLANSSAVNVVGGTLAGTGVIAAPVTVNSGGTLAPGAHGIGTLTLSNTLNLAGSTIMQVAAGSACDKVVGLTALTFGGTLTIVTNGPLSGGEVFQLFSAGSYSGTFSSVTLPPLASPLGWDDSLLLTAGTLSVTGAVAPPSPIPLNVVRAGDVLTFSWTNAAFRLQAQTNTRAVGYTTNWFNYPGGGTSPVLVTNNPANPAVFFRLISP